MNEDMKPPLPSSSTPPIAAEEINWRWKRPDLRGTTFTINGYVRRNIVECIRTKLGTQDLQVLEQSCFGHYLRAGWYKSVVCNAAIHALLCNEVVKEGANDEDFSFRVGRCFIRFTPRDYALVTGLKFVGSDFNIRCGDTPPEGSVYSRYKQLKDGCTLDKIRNDFIAGRFNEKPGDAIKVAKIMIACYLLLGVDGHKKITDNWMWKMVEETRTWESFPWGLYSWQVLSHHIRGIPVVGTGRVIYHFYGNIYALMVWACEVVPSLCGHCVRTRFTDPHLQPPRMSRYRFKRVCKVDFTYYFDQQLDCLECLTPTSEEERELYMPCVEGAKYVHIPSLRRKRRSKMKDTDVRPTRRRYVRRRFSDEGSSRGERGDGENNCDNVADRAPDPPVGGDDVTNRAHICTPDLSERVPDVSNGGHDASNMPGVSTEDQVPSISLTQLREYIDRAIEQAVDRSISLTQLREYIDRAIEQSVDRTLERHMDRAFDRAIDQGMDRVIRELKKHLDEKDGIVDRARGRIPSDLLRSPFKPLPSRPRRNYSEDTFKKWLVESTEQLNTGCGILVAKEWFHGIFSSIKRLKPQHINAYLGILQYEPSFLNVIWDVDSLNNTVIIDCEFLALCKAMWDSNHQQLQDLDSFSPRVREEFGDDQALARAAKWVCGCRPYWGKLQPWWKLDSVLAVWNTGGCEDGVKHWIAVRIKLKKQKIVLHDSVVDDDTGALLKKRMRQSRCIRRMIPIILERAGFYNERTELVPSWEWRLAFAETTQRYVQNDGVSSGPLAVQTVESIVQNRFPPNTTNVDVHEIRYNMARTIWQYSDEAHTIGEWYLEEGNAM